MEGAVRLDVLVLGVGNVLLRDEGLGVHAIRRLAERYRLPESVTVVDGGTSGLDLLDLIAGREQLIIVDAVAHDGPPETMIRMVDGEIPAFLQTKISPHQLGLSDLLAVLQLTGDAPSRITLFGLQPADMGLGLDLSAPLSARVDALVEAVASELSALGCDLQDMRALDTTDAD